ncbi:5'-methylthioadenosine/adenosylhomocysteine nucleosidase [Schleiferilactobacillus perolens]|jgi:adenosylhomocysteine nucleosidase|uniref:5'-methylthioadenosine/adenosylhomocysteine nucleosidase n=1 Tax=Schleiferilactobacillus perolens TaxID=100468 RepID=UPI0023558FFC|nr:5'-methylthioadenosine/adenosylhomocysteine nucleosidase [Schleiferilactobacillus perolens]MCI1892304.1 5'-methylthioadenosine/adenosylhomocysteine nucleosidase [Schleiferilactobacillus harbinensis]MCI1913170.1 5'-methylthioadenosine/adenosylhomocysteine nucleosidase [Schleiferilactobacillus harbinensis]MCI2171286.1 5'-methylthioadenosine/adenosylhomocysteine nucleosidase [Schleiferilactobacillus perolens]
MKIGVLCAMEEEIRVLRGQLADRQQVTIGTSVFDEGTMHGQSVVLIESGIGKVQASINAALLLAHFKPDLIVNTGSAGGIGEGLQVGDVVISTGVAYHDVDLQPAGYLPGQLPDQPQIFEADPTFVKQFAQAATTKGQAVHEGLIVTGDQFIASQSQIAQIKKNFPQALAAEMEGAAVGQAAHEFHTPFVIIRAMSDNGNEEAQVSFDEFIVDAGKRSAETFIRFVENMA